MRGPSPHMQVILASNLSCNIGLTPMADVLDTVSQNSVITNSYNLVQLTQIPS